MVHGSGRNLKDETDHLSIKSATETMPMACSGTNTQDNGMWQVGDKPGLWVKVSELARVSSMSKRTIYRYIEDGSLAEETRRRAKTYEILLTDPIQIAEVKRRRKVRGIGEEGRREPTVPCRLAVRQDLLYVETDLGKGKMANLAFNAFLTARVEKEIGDIIRGNKRGKMRIRLSRENYDKIRVAAEKAGVTMTESLGHIYKQFLMAYAEDIGGSRDIHGVPSAKKVRNGTIQCPLLLSQNLLHVARALREDKMSNLAFNAFLAAMEETTINLLLRGRKRRELRIRITRENYAKLKGVAEKEAAALNESLGQMYERFLIVMHQNK